MLTAPQMNAQNDGSRGLFGMGPSGEASPHRSLLNPSSGNITNQTYGSDADGFGITNQTYGQDESAPLGSGLLMMAVAGACYAGMKRNKKQKGKTMRKYNFILMAFALLLGTAQCKKEPVTPNEDNNGGVRITLKVNDGESGEKLNVYPATGAVIFTQGDKIYVGNNGKYVGTLTFENGLFQGTIDGDLSTEDNLHFYFVGNKPTSPTELASGTTTYTVDISDQTAYLPAISYAPSKEKYSPTTTAYSAKLLNKSALVKFLPSQSVYLPITISGMKNNVTIDFEHNTLAPTGTTGGITLYSVSDTEKWAILLPQDAVPSAAVTGIGFTAENIAVPTITDNMYYNSGIGISMTAVYKTYEANNSNWASVLASFNAEPTPNPVLVLTGDITINDEGSVISRANGTLDLNGHTLKWDNGNTHALFLQNNVLGESLTITNGTIEAPVDGNIGWLNWYCGTVIFEDITFKREVFFDGHLCELTNVNFAAGSMFENYTGDSGNPGLVIINSGKFNCAFHANGNIATKGATTIYGGKFSTNPSSIANVIIPEGYAVKSNTDSDSGTYPWVVSALPEGALRGEFTINVSGGKVYFSKGNLKYSNGIWSFHEQQYDRCFTSNGDVTSYYTSTGTFDLFCWGTSGYNHGAVAYQPWSTSTEHSDYYAYGSSSYNLYNQTGQADWGCNAIYNGGNTENSGWRTLSNGEWNYIINTRTTSSGIRYARANVNNLNGVILLPDNWSTSYYTLNSTNSSSANYSTNQITAEQWSTLEQHGAVFLPAAGLCLETSTKIAFAGSNGYY